jgi:ketosteroid isomerase-like protein
MHCWAPRRAARPGWRDNRRIEAAGHTRLVEEAYRAWNARGSRGFAEFTADDVELQDAPELPDAATWRGREALVGRFDELVAATNGRWADIDDVRPLGDEILVSLTWRFEQGDPATLACVYHVVRVEGDRIARIRVFLDEAQATS